MTYSPRWVLNGIDLTSSPYMVLQDSANPGTAETVSSILASQVVDGDIELTQRRGNRTYELPIAIEGDDRATIASAQAALVTAVEQRLGTLEFDPGDGSDVTVFETFAGTAALSNGTDDVGADSGLQRITLSIPCRPFVRPLDAVSIDAPSVVGSTTTTVDSGSSTTGWSLLSTSAPTFHNIVSNPSFESNATGWAAGSGTSTAVRSTVTSAVGSASLQMDPIGTGQTWSHVSSPLLNVSAGSSWLVSMRHEVDANSQPSSARFLVRWYSDSAGSVQIGSEGTVSLGTGSGGSFSTKTAKITAPAGAQSLRIFPGALPGSAGWDSAALTDRWYIDAVMVTEGANTYVPGYFDGATTDTAAINYSWDGTANNSTSTATWTAASLASVSGSVKGTVYGRSSVAIRRTGTVTMSSLPYMRIRGTASTFSDVGVTVADNGGSAITPVSYSFNATTGVFEIVLKRDAGFTAVDVTATRSTGAISTTTGLFVAVDSIEITDTPIGGKAQTRQVPVYGSQRTELSLAVLGLDAAGTSPIALGEQVLVHTATAGDDSRAKFLGCRATSGVAGPTSDTTAITGSYNTLATTSSPTSFPFSAAVLLPGQYVAYARLQGTSAATRTLSYAAALDGAGALDLADPVTGWYTSQVSVTTAWRIVPLGYLMLPPANIEDPTATLTIKVAADTASVVRLDEIWLAHVESGQVTLLDTNDPGISAVRLDAATVDASEPSAWVGVATSTGTGAMMAAGSRILAFDQHMAEPGLLQISTVTPGCATSRVSARYFPRYAHDVAPLPGS